MSNIGLIIEERSRDIGDFLVGRLLPFRKKRMVGPFIFLDHMGPKRLEPGQKMDIGSHPHIGLSTLTYLFNGRIVHRDSIGSLQEITPGAVNWMTAGKGIVHSERSPKDLTEEQRLMHGLQIWVALPKHEEEREPSFHHTKAEELPAWKENGIDYKLIAGKAFGYHSPVPVFSDLFMVELRNLEEGFIDVGNQLDGEIAIYVQDGAIEACGETIEKGHLLVAKQDDVCQFNLQPNSHCILFGGQPFPEERHIYWNFVASSKETIEAAKEKWRRQEMGKIEGEDGFIPLPNY